MGKVTEQVTTTTTYTKYSNVPIKHNAENQTMFPTQEYYNGKHPSLQQNFQSKL